MWAQANFSPLQTQFLQRAVLAGCLDTGDIDDRRSFSFLHRTVPYAAVEVCCNKIGKVRLLHPRIPLHIKPFDGQPQLSDVPEISRTFNKYKKLIHMPFPMHVAFGIKRKRLLTQYAMASGRKEQEPPSENRQRRLNRA